MKVYTFIVPASRNCRSHFSFNYYFYRTHGLATLQPNNHSRSSGLPFNGLHPRNPCNYSTWITTHLPTPKGWKAECWPGWL